MGQCMIRRRAGCLYGGLEGGAIAGDRGGGGRGWHVSVSTGALEPVFLGSIGMRKHWQMGGGGSVRAAWGGGEENKFFLVRMWGAGGGGEIDWGTLG